MRIDVIAVGRAREGPESALFAAYVARLPWRVRLVEVEARGRPVGPELKRREGKLLLDAVPAGALAVALDERGEALPSADFAARLGRWRDQGRHLAFLIGGADGLDEAVRARADMRLSLGPMTWPHLLVRAMLAEQLWRAYSILSGHPYHRA